MYQKHNINTYINTLLIIILYYIIHLIYIIYYINNNNNDKNSTYIYIYIYELSVRIVTDIHILCVSNPTRKSASIRCVFI